MPTYEYKCKTCGKEFEYTQRITEPAITKCPFEICDCEAKGEGMVERKISKGIGLIFNGKGFYQTDYANKSSSLGTSYKKTNSSSSEPSCETCPAASECLSA
jgi:putative FmdB family regulatory protein